MKKDLNTMQKELVDDGILTDELISFFRDIDTMNSTGMMTWLVDTAKGGLKKIELGSGVTYNGKKLTKDEYTRILNDNLSDLLVGRIFKKSLVDRILEKLHIVRG